VLRHWKGRHPGLLCYRADDAIAPIVRLLTLTDIGISPYVRKRDNSQGQCPSFVPFRDRHRDFSFVCPQGHIRDTSEKKPRDKGKNPFVPGDRHRAYKGTVCPRPHGRDKGVSIRLCPSREGRQSGGGLPLVTSHSRKRGSRNPTVAEEDRGDRNAFLRMR